MIPIGTDIDEAPPAALRKSFTFVKEEKRKKEEEALLAFVDTFRGYQVRIRIPVESKTSASDMFHFRWSNMTR